MRFDEVVEAVDQLPLEDQEALLALLRRRSLAQQRAELARDVEEARQEFQAVGAQPRTTAELMREILS